MARLRSSLVLLVGFISLTGTVYAAQPPEEKTNRRTDLYGDPLPEGAVARLGTVRLRHGDDVLSVAYSPDGKLIASGGNDNIVCLWDADTGKKMGQLLGPKRYIRQVAFSTDSKLLVAANDDDEGVLVWAIPDRKKLFQLKGSCVAVSPDGETLATGCKDKLIRLWNLKTGREVIRLAGHEKEVWCLAFSSDGKLLASGSKDQSARLWNVATGKTIQRLGNHQNGVHSIAFVLDGKRLGLASNGTLHIYDLDTGERIHKLGNPKVGVSAVLASPEATALATSYGGRIRFWDAATGKELRELTSQSWDWHEEVNCLAYSPDGKQLVCAARGQRICRFDLTTGREILIRHAHQEAIYGVAIAPDGKTIATASGDRTVRLWDATTGRELRSLEGHKFSARNVAFSFDGRILASAGSDDKVILWDWATGRELRRMPGKSVTFSPDGKILAAGSHDREGEGTYGTGIIKLYDPATGNELRRLRGHHRRFESIVFSPDGRMLASIEDQPYPIPGREVPKQEPSSIRLWDVATGIEWLDFGRGRAGAPLFFSTDGWTLISSGPEDDRLHFWEAATGKERDQIRGKPQSIWQLACAANGRFFATVGSEATVRVHDWPTARELRQFAGRGGSIFALTFAPDGMTLISGGADTTATVWDLGSLKRPAKGAVQELTVQQLQEAWADLGLVDAGRAYRALGLLVSTPRQSESYLKEQLKPSRIDRERVAKLISDLDSEQYAVREAASRSLTELGEVAAPFLQRALSASPSTESRRRLERLLPKAIRGPVTTPQVQELRALEALEQIGTNKAQQVLETLTTGDPDARLTRDAKAALQRLEKRTAK